MTQLPRTVPHQICHDVLTELNNGFPLGSEYLLSGVCARSSEADPREGKKWSCAYCLQGWHLGNVPSKARVGVVLAASQPAHCGDKNEGSLRCVPEEQLALAQVKGSPQSKTGRLQGAAVGGAVRAD